MSTTSKEQDMGVIEGRTWLEIISPLGCERYLRHETVGRIGVVVNGHAEIFPINFAVDDDGAIVFRTDQGTKLSALLQNETVAFEIDGLDHEHHAGWSVLVVGQARWLAAPEEMAAARRLNLEPWAVGEKANYVRIAPTKVSGRLIHLTRKEQ
jgi:nitroimidazol reductase NimA-like FMN-containing flavoprotein (pyridoxamine 5'-phosphate oxidase superfamily)